MSLLLNYFRLSAKCNRSFVVYPESAYAGAGAYRVRLTDRSKRVYTIFLDGRAPDSCGTVFFRLTERSTRYYPVRFAGGIGPIGPVPSLDLDFLTLVAMPGSVTFTRASTATYFDAAGQIQVMASGSPRLADYNPFTLTRMGFLVEGLRTNSCLRSTFAGGSAGNPPTGWVATGVGMTPTASTFGAADGSTGYTFTAVASQEYISQSITLTPSNQTFRISVYVEAVTGAITNQNVALATGLPAGASISAWFVNGVASAAGTQAVVGRLSFTVSGVYVAGAASFRFGAGTTGAVTATVRISRPQVEAGTFPSSYIPTTTATVTRAADLAVITGAAAAAIINNVEGVLNAELAFAGGNSTFGPSIRIALSTQNTGADKNFILNVNGDMGGATDTNSIRQATPTILGATSVGSIVKAAYSYANNSCNFAKNGGHATRDVLTPNGMPATVTVALGGFSYTSQRELYGHLRRVRIYRVSMTDAQLDALTV